jgi:hypothetical protein
MNNDIDLGMPFDDGYKLPAFWRWIALVVMLAASPFVFADTLTYQSQTLPGTSTLVDGGVSIPSPVNDFYIITVTIAGPLAANLSNAAITPTSWIVTCQNCGAPLSSAPPNIATAPMVYMTATSAVFMFSTDSTGKITNWNFAINGGSLLGDGTGGILSQTNGSYNSGDTGVSTQVANGHQYTVTVNGPKGTWAQSSLSNPTPAPTPAPTANVQLRTCSGTWGPVSNNVPAGITQNASGVGLHCTGSLKGYPGSWYTKATTDGGKTYEFVTLKSLNLGKGT